MVDPPKKAREGQSLVSQPSKNLPRKEVQQKTIEGDLPKESIYNRDTCRRMK